MVTHCVLDGCAIVMTDGTLEGGVQEAEESELEVVEGVLKRGRVEVGGKIIGLFEGS